MMTGIPQGLIDFAHPWADLYSGSKVLPTVVTFAHVGGLLLSGGLAITADRVTLRLKTFDAPARAQHLADLARTHRAVIAGLVVIALSGLLMLAADLETFLGSPVFWIKMTLVVALLANGYRMTRLERALREGDASSGAGWNRLRSTAIVSLVLWFVITLAGVTLVNVA